MTTTDLALAPPPRMSLPDKLAYTRALAEAGVLPAQYRKQPANLLYAVEYAEMLGLHPLAAVTGVHVIEGKPAADSALMTALVRKAGHKVRVSGSSTEAVCEIIRADDPTFTFRATFTQEDAKRAGLWGRGNWSKYPTAMLKARAVSACCRDAAEDALMGVHYTPEELGAVVDEDGIPVGVEQPAAPVQPVQQPVPGKNMPHYDEVPVQQPEPEALPDDLRQLVLDAWADLNTDDLRDVFRLVRGRDVSGDAPTVDDNGEPTTVRGLFDKAAREIGGGNRPAGSSEVVDAVVVEQPKPKRPERAKRGPVPAEEDQWVTDAPQAHPDDSPLPLEDEQTDAQRIAAGIMARNGQ